MFIRLDNFNRILRIIFFRNQKKMTVKVKLLNIVEMLHCMYEYSCKSVCKGKVIVYYVTGVLIVNVYLIVQLVFFVLIDKFMNIVE